MDLKSKDEIILLGLSMDLPELAVFCRTNKRINSLTCANKDFWRMKIERDRPGALDIIHKQLRNLDYKELYQSLRNKYIYYVSFNLKSNLQIHGIVKGDIGFFPVYHTYPSMYQNEYDIGDKVWVLVNNRPDFLYEYPQLYDTREAAIRDIYYILREEFEGSDENVENMMAITEEQLSTGNYVEIPLEYDSYVVIKFRIEQLTIH
jgi:hypothetical protein